MNNSKFALAIKALLKYLSGLVIVGLLLFPPAGTFHYWNAWLFIGVLFIPMLFTGIILIIKDPTLLTKRLNNKEKEDTQKIVIFISTLMFIGGFLLSAFDFKYQWLPLPAWVSIAAAVVMFSGYILYFEVLQENAFLSRTVEIQEEQKVIDTKLYGIVRHPMYTSTLLIFCTIPLVLGSFYAFLLYLLYPVILAKRIQNEEKVLLEGLKGYDEYMKKVKYKLIPYIW